MAVPMLKPGLAKRPAKKRHMTKEVMFCEKPAPRVNTARPGKAQIYTAFLPKVSLDGPAMMGPKDRPRR